MSLALSIRERERERRVARPPGSETDRELSTFKLSFPPSLNQPLYCSLKLKFCNFTSFPYRLSDAIHLIFSVFLCLGTMRPERNPLDLNNLPEEYGRDGKQNLQGSSSITSEASGFRKKKSGRNDGKDECGKVYECRFCSLKFCKSQALGGHMNRHRQERETETLNRARQLVLNNENLAAHGALHLGLRDPNFLGGSKSISSGNFHQSGNMGEPCLPLTSVHPTTLFMSTSSPISSSPPPPPYQAYFYHSQPMNDYLVGHVFPASNSHQHINLNYLGDQNDTNYTCIGAPIGQSFRQEDRTARMADMSVPERGEGDGSLHNQQDGLKWGRGYAGKQKRIDHFSINRFQDGF